MIRTPDGEKPYMVSITANDAYEQDCLQARYETSPLYRQRALGETMKTLFSLEEERRHDMQAGQGYSLRIR